MYSYFSFTESYLFGGLVQQSIESLSSGIVFRVSSGMFCFFLLFVIVINGCSSFVMFGVLCIFGTGVSSGACCVSGMYVTSFDFDICVFGICCSSSDICVSGIVCCSSSDVWCSSSDVCWELFCCSYCSVCGVGWFSGWRELCDLLLFSVVVIGSGRES